MNSSFERIDKNIVFTYSYIGGKGYFSYQSYTFDFAEWITLLTLCLAPLLAHVITGVLSIAYLNCSRPQWHDILPLYHPIAIIWRYMVLVDRRLRATIWDLGDLAAANTVFWTSYGWDGDERIAKKSRRYLTRLPETGKVRSLMSSEMLGTAVTTLQGLQAAYSMVTQITISGPSYVKGSTMADVFSWLSILGLVRLSAAAWITNDIAYAYCNTGNIMLLTDANEGSRSPGTTQAWQRIPSDSDTKNDTPRYSQPGWQSYLLRLAFFIFWAAITIYCFYFTFFEPLFHYEMVYTATTTNILVLPLYLLLVAPLTILFGSYAFKTPKKGLSTIVPCAGTWWYKLYVIMWYMFAASVVVTAAVETTIDRCGHYTSAPFQPLTCK